MNTGLGISEVLVIVVLILIFFGSKELPLFIKKGAQLMAKVRHYSDKVKKEIDTIARSVEQPVTESVKPLTAVKDELRKKFLAARTSLDPELRGTKSKLIFDCIKNQPDYEKSSAVMIYASAGSEVDTWYMIEEMLKSGKRVVIPYCRDNDELGIAEIKDPAKDLVEGKYRLFEPRPELRDNFFKSDLKLVICPGVAFDTFGARLGRGKACYDRFLDELKGKVTLVGVAFGCQISTENLPFDYHDVIMDQVITENGIVLPERVLVSSTGDRELHTTAATQELNG